MMDYPLITYNYPLKNPAEVSSFKKTAALELSHPPDLLRIPNCKTFLRVRAKNVFQNVEVLSPGWLIKSKKSMEDFYGQRTVK